MDRRAPVTVHDLTQAGYASPGPIQLGTRADLNVRPLISVTWRELARTRSFSLDFQFPPPLSFRLDLAFLRNSRFILLPLGVPSRFLNIMTDASGVGWGIVLPHSQFSGKFDASLLQADIALKELLTIFWALLLVPSRCSVMVHTDSLVSLQVLRRGYSRNPLLDQLSRVIWRWMFSRSISLRLSLLPGNYNVRVDQLSRGLVISTEWSISNRDFLALLRLVGFVPQIDLLATGLNNRCDLYMSPCPVLQAVAIDAFNHCWDSWNLLCLFSLYPLILKALAKLRESVFVNAIFVCPELEGRAWFPSLLFFAHKLFRLSLRLQQVVQDSLVIQSEPTLLIAFVLSGNTSPAGSQMTL